jgi:hypothetical protein
MPVDRNRSGFQNVLYKKITKTKAVDNVQKSKVKVKVKLSLYFH